LRKLRTDCRLGYLGGEFRRLLEEQKILHQKSVPYCHQQNGSAERCIQTIEQLIRLLLLQSGALHRFWSEAAANAAYTLNTTPPARMDVTPYELFHGEQTPVTDLRTFGAVAVHWISHGHRTKLEPTGSRMVFLGYPEDFKAYRLYDPSSRKIVASRNVHVYEDKLYWKNEDKEQIPNKEVPFEIGTEPNDENVIDPVEPEATGSDLGGEMELQKEELEHRYPIRSTRGILPAATRPTRRCASIQ